MNIRHRTWIDSRVDKLIRKGSVNRIFIAHLNGNSFINNFSKTLTKKHKLLSDFSNINLKQIRRDFQMFLRYIRKS